MSNHQTVFRKLEPWSELKDKVVLVTGTSSGIGCKIIAAARRIDHLNSLCSEINNNFAPTKIQASALELDISSDEATTQEAVSKAWKIYGNINALINNAGIRGNVNSSLDISEEEWNKVIKTNLTGTWLISKYVSVLMRDAKQGGSVINISSISGLHRGIKPGGLAYSCSKGGVDTMTRMMAVELGVYKIRVNSIAPGLFKSEITQGLLEKEWLKNVTERIVPLKMGQSVDPGLTSLVRYLIHDSSQYVTGNTYIVDSGATLPGVPIFSSL
ncbi:putative tropinone reductase [Cardamine amara subsp. amara]|uniref:Tropinone reductase n=1 Tax=Cardamine amara subsp. amara TaxID=228776 RepID=A0ABD1BQ33_CARAN